MGRHEDPLAFLPRLVASYQRGMYTPAEAAGYCLEVANEWTAAAVVQALPPDLREHLAARVRKAPMTEADWADLDLVDFGVVGGLDRPDLSPEARVAKYRTAVEELRRTLKPFDGSQAEPLVAPDPRR